MQLLILKYKQVFEFGCHLVDDSVQFQQCEKMCRLLWWRSNDIAHMLPLYQGTWITWYW